jgi:hypothetical protein
VTTLVGQRVFGMALRYEDENAWNKDPVVGVTGMRSGLRAGIRSAVAPVAWTVVSRKRYGNNLE